MIQTDSLYRYYNLDGSPAFDGGYSIAGAFKSGRALVMRSGRYHYIDTSGVEIFGNIDAGTDFFGEAAAIKKDGYWLLVDKNGNRIGNEKYDAVQFPSEGFLPVKKHGAWYFVDDKGKELNSEGYRYVRPFKSGFAKIWTGNGDYPDLWLRNVVGNVFYEIYDSDQYRNQLARIKNFIEK
jgi:hypothetical protein